MGDCLTESVSGWKGGHTMFRWCIGVDTRQEVVASNLSPSVG